MTQGNLPVTGCCHFRQLTFWLDHLDSLRGRRSGSFHDHGGLSPAGGGKTSAIMKNGSYWPGLAGEVRDPWRPVRWPRHAGSIVIGRLGRAVNPGSGIQDWGSRNGGGQ